MKIKISKFCFTLTLLFNVVFSFAQTPTDIFISEYVEGSSLNKAIEIYNGTGSAIDLTTNNYVIQMYFNGSSTAGLTLSLSGVVANNDVFVITQSAATFITANGGTLVPDQTSSASWYNGDDAIVLRKGGAAGIILDIIGQIGFDPGAEWGTGLTSTSDNSLRRKPVQCAGDLNPADTFDPTTQWNGFATDTFDGLGSHASSCVISGPSLNITPSSLNFTTTFGTPSSVQSYSVQGNSLTEDVLITASVNFQVSLSSGGPFSESIIVSAASANTSAVPVYVVYNPISSGSHSEIITNISGSVSSNLSVQGTSATSTLTPIYIIQGSGGASTLDGSIVTTEGIVTGDFQELNQLRGFYIQDIAGDSNVSTSDGIFVFNASFAVNVGDHVRLTAEVDEYFALTELKNITSLNVLSSGNSLMAPVSINLPVSSINDFEKYEGMLVSFPQTLTVTETYTLGRYGEVPLSVDGRLINPTNIVDPNDNPASGTTSVGTSNVAAVNELQDLNNRRKILLDDGSTIQNPVVVPYIDPIDKTLRVGSTLANLTGVLDYAFNIYRLQPTQTPAFNYEPRPALPDVGNANVKVASFNVLNYFNGNGNGGGFPTSRGANTLVEFNRQRIKIIEAIKQLDADVIGLMEMENDGDEATSAIADLVNGLNAATSAGTYAYVLDATGENGNTGTDEIKVALIYKPSVVNPMGLARTDMNAVHNRPPLAQTFYINANGRKFTVVVSHFKSKGCTGATGLNVDQLDGQGCFTESRKQQANALLNYIDDIQVSTGADDVIAIGDFNSYEQEDPMDILYAGGLTNLLTNTYSYVFNGQSGSLDHALVTNSFISKISGASKWHINADEPIVKDYNQEFNPAYVYSPDAFRSSDHDPVLIGLNISAPPVVADIAESISEDSSLYFTKAMFTSAYSDADGDSLSRIQITRLPHNGHLLLDTTVVALNAEINLTDASNLIYISDLNYSGIDTIQWKGFDGHVYSAQAADIVITINSINDVPFVSITNPADSSEFIAGSSILIEAHAGDVDGTIAKVIFFQNNVMLAEDTDSPFIFTWNSVEAGDYSLLAEAFDNNGAVATSTTVHVTVPACKGEGTITRDFWANIKGSTVLDLTSSPAFATPTSTTLLTSFEGPRRLAEKYGSRIRGYICAPQTGNYIFYIASDDNSELWLSTDYNPVNKIKIAYLNQPVPPRGWNVLPTQKSIPVYLIKGTQYYIEALHKEKVNSDHLAVAWTLPNGVTEGPIPGKRLSPWIDGAARANNNVVEDHENNLKFDELHAYPVPVHGRLTLQFSEAEDGLAGIVIISALNIEVINTSAIIEHAEKKIEISTAHLNSGIYTIHVATQRGRYVKRVLVVNE